MISSVFLWVVRLMLPFQFLLPPHHTTPCERRGDAGGRSCRAQAHHGETLGRTAADIVASLADLQDLEEMGCSNEAQTEGLRVGSLRGH